MASGSSSDVSIGGIDSTSSSTRTSSRRSLGELLAPQQPRNEAFADMPTLSSFRADEMSAVLGTSYTSFASNSRGGDLRCGDCDMSLPSLSSFRMEDLSTCSSFHSIQTNTTHLSDHSGEGWASFTSGNVSAEMDSDGDDESEFATKTSSIGESSDENLKKPARRSSSSAKKARSLSPMNGKSSTKSKHDIPSDTASTARASELAVADQGASSLPMKRPIRTLSPSPDEQQSISAEHVEEPKSDQPACAPTTRSSSRERLPVERTESLPMNVLNSARNKKSGSSSSQSLRNSPEGSSSSLRGGDSLPRLPRRTSTCTDEDPPPAPVPTRVTPDDDDTGRYSDDASKLSEDPSRISDDASKLSDDEITRGSDDDISLNSDVESDFSIDTDDDNDDSITDDFSDSIAPEACDAVSSRQCDSGITEYNNVERIAGSDETCGEEPEIEETHSGDEPKMRETPGAFEESDNCNDSTDQAEAEELSAATATTVITIVEPTQANLNGARNEEPKLDESLKKPSSFRSGEEVLAKKTKLRGETRAEESGTSVTDIEVEDPEDAVSDKREEQKEPENKRGKLLRKVSSSFRSLGRTASFRNSFRMLGKRASKIKQRGSRGQADDNHASQPLLDDPESKHDVL